MSGQTHRGTTYEKKLIALAERAIKEISLLRAPVIQFCGPISTGGFGNTKENLDHLRSVVEYAQQKNISVFNQVSYERHLDEALKNHQGYDYPLLDYFYKPILSSGKIGALFFLPLWQSSTGSTWEHDFAKSVGIPIFYLKDMVSGEIESFYKELSR